MKPLLFILFYFLCCPLISQNDFQKTSHIVVPFEIPFQKLEEFCNKSLEGIIYKDSSHTDNDNDQIKCTVWKNGTIKITPYKPGLLKIDVPLKVWIEKGIGSMGLYHYQSTNFQMQMSYLMAYNLHSDWKLATKTISNGYTWVQKPALQVRGVEIPITKLVDYILQKKQDEYATLIDYQLQKNLNLKTGIQAFWSNISNPILLSQEYNSWLVVDPLSISAKPLQHNAQSIFSTLVLDVSTHTYIGLLDTQGRKSSLAKLIPYSPSSDNFEIYTAVHIPYEEATKMAQNTLINQEFEFENGKYKITIRDISIYPSDSHLTIETTMDGSFKGKVIIYGLPYYDSIVEAIRFQDLDYEIKTKNILMKVANWIFSGKILNNLKENFSIPMADKLQMVKASAQSSINQEKQGFKLSGTIFNIRPNEIYIQPDKMLLRIETTGKLRVSF